MTTGKARVLVAEDDGGVRRPLQKFLQLHHFEVFTALDVPDRVGPAWSRRSG